MDAAEKMLQAAVDQACSKLGISTPFGWNNLSISDCLPAARIACLSTDEVATLSDDFPLSVVNPRNEAAALSLLVSSMDEVCNGEDGEVRKSQLLALCESYSELEGALVTAPTEQEEGATPFPDSSPEAQLFRWGEERGVVSRLSAATFSGGLRGLQAATDLEPGSCAVAVPEHLIITSITAWESDLGAVLAKIPGLSDDMASLIWTLVDSRDPDSPWTPFWQCLPGAFNTGLSAPEEALEILEGTPALLEVLQARQHLQEQYESVQPVFTALLRAYSDLLQPELFTWERYVWAAELWYAYAIQVEFPDGKQLSGLVPVVSLLNHSPTPHVVRFSRVDEGSSCLKLCPFRPCKRGQQCLLSYGPFPNFHLLVFYGFTIPNNPFDIFPLSFEVQDGDPLAERKQQLLSRLSLPLDHNLHPPPAALPHRLLDCLRLIIADQLAMDSMDACGRIAGVGTSADAEVPSGTWQGGPVDEENEAAAWSVLASTLQELLQPFVQAAAAAESLPAAASPHPFAVAAKTYITGQVAVLSHALALCKPQARALA